MFDTIWWKHKGFWDQSWWIPALESAPFHNAGIVDKDYAASAGAVVSIASDLHEEEFDAIQNLISRLKWAVLLLTSREERKFPWHKLAHPNMKLWLQIPRDDERKLYAEVFGQPGCCRLFGHMPHSGLEAAPSEKSIGFFFSGQCTNAHRRDCVTELMRRPEVEGEIIATAGFAQGIVFDDYVKRLRRARVAPCPSGYATASTFRCFEALQCGALPIADRRCAHNKPDFNYWVEMLGYEPPFPTVASWSEVHAHLDRLSDEAVWKKEVAIALAWWEKYKAQLKDQLVEDATALERRS